MIHFPTPYIVSIIAIIFLTIKIYIYKNEKPQLKYLVKNADDIKKLKNRLNY